MTISIAPSFDAQNSFFEREIRLFPFRRLFLSWIEQLVQYYLRILNEYLDKGYTDIQGALVVVKDYTKESAQKDLPSVKKALKLLIAYKSLLERIDYLNSKDIEGKIDLVISGLYDVEILLKKKAFVGEARTPAQPELLDAMAAVSHEALKSALSR